MATITALYIFGVIFLAGITQCITGFGFNLVAAPLLALVIGPKQAVIAVLFVGAITKGYMVYRTWHEGAFARILFIFAASIVGALPGAYVLQAVSDTALKIIIGITLLAATAALSANYTFSIRRHGLVKSLTGLLSGFFGATTSLSGPPIVMYMMNEGIDKCTMRADLARYFLLGNAATLVLAGLMGTVHTDWLPVYAALALPAVLLSWWVGQRIFERVDAALFRHIALAVIAASGLLALGSGLWPLITGLLAGN